MKVTKSVVEHAARSAITAAYVVDTEYNDNISPSLSALTRCVNLAVKIYGWEVSGIRFGSRTTDIVRVSLRNGDSVHVFGWRNFLND